MPQNLIIAIDGPCGAGKSTISKLLAEHLGYVNIDTGAMYRTVALAAQRANIAADDEAALQELCNELEIRFTRHDDGERVWLGDEDVSGLIRTPQMSLLTSKIAASPVVRASLLKLQRKMAVDGGVVLEGRDIGSVVFPDAQVKFYLCASAEARGQRRYDELCATGADVDLEQTIAEVKRRDEGDRARVCAPLVKVDDAVEIDATNLSIDQVLEQMLSIVRQRQSKVAL